MMTQNFIREFKMFKLEIQLGNDAMRTAWDCGQALNQIAKKLCSDSFTEAGEYHGSIKDINGNKVGFYNLVLEEDDAQEDLSKNQTEEED